MNNMVLWSNEKSRIYCKADQIISIRRLLACTNPYRAPTPAVDKAAGSIKKSKNMTAAVKSNSAISGVAAIDR